MSDAERPAGAPMPGLRRAWLRELGIDHVWTLPAPPTPVGPAPTRASTLNAPPVESATATPPTVASGDAVPDTLPASPMNPREPVLAEAPNRTTAPTAEPAPTAASSRAGEYTREPLPGSRPGGSNDGEYSREPIADPYARVPDAAGHQTPAGTTVPWVAVRAPATSPSQEDWLLVGEGLDHDVSSPARQRFLTAMLAAQAHALGEVVPWHEAVEEGAAALILIGPAAATGLAPGGAPYAVGDIAIDGASVPALLLPPLAEVSLNAEGKAAAWRGLLRLSAQAGGEPE